MRRLLGLAGAVVLLAAACAGEMTPANVATDVAPMTPAATVEPTRLVIVTPIVSSAPSDDTQSGDRVPAEIVATAEAIFGDGGIYVASLLRPSDVPAGWLLDRAPRFVPRSPEPGETYAFACETLPARSTGVATVGYRSLEGLPSLSVEYVVYPSAEAAAAALADMQTAAESCGAFGVSLVGSESVTAEMTPLALSPFGDASFAIALDTRSPTTGDLLTHVVKILQDNVVIGINHAVRSDDAPPDREITEQAARLTVQYLSQIE